MHGFGAFFFFVGVILLLFLPVFGILLMILGVIMMMAGGARRKEIAQARMHQAEQAARMPCPHCAEPIRREAKVCRYCGREVPLVLTEPLASKPRR